MSTFTKLTWPIQALSAVCALQNLALPGNLVLNGTLVDLSIPNQVSFIKAKMIRSISISTASTDYSGTQFIIAGLQNGAYVTETLNGPVSNVAPVYGSKYYDIITSVTSSTAFTGVSVGTGDAGFLPLIVVNNVVASVINYSGTVLIPSSNSGTIDYSLFQTLDEVNNNFIPFVTQTTKFFPALGLSGIISAIGNSSAITNFVLFKINSSTNPATDTLDFIFLQE